MNITFTAMNGKLRLLFIYMKSELTFILFILYDNNNDQLL